jgi:MFS family permease
METEKKKSLGNVFYIGLLSFFGGISQDMFVPILPIYLANVIGLDKSFIGLTEGIVTASASIFKIISGYLSDKFKKNKPIVFVGYFLSLVSRPLLAFFTGGVAILGLRSVDGIGKGIKDSPKDILIAGSTNAENRGKGFGVARMLDTFGSVVGPIVLFILLYLFRNNNLKYHYILLLCALPLITTLLILVLKVREVPVPVQREVLNKKTNTLPKTFWWFLGIMAFFAIGNSSDAFLILRAQNAGVTLLAIPLVYALFNFFYASASVPLGSLSDKIGRVKVILLGFGAYALAYLGFGLATQAWHIWILFAFYGLYYATTEGVAKAFIADMVDPEHRGWAYGIYNASIGVIALPASLIAGILWDKINPSVPFLFGAGVAVISTFLLIVYVQVFSFDNHVKLYDKP